MSGALESKERGVVVIGPAWYSCGSYEVFKRQMQCMRDLGLKTYFLAIAPLITIGNSSSYWGYYYSMTTDLDADFRGHTGRSRVPFKHATFWTDFPKSLGRSVGYAKTLHTRVMSIPKSLKDFIGAHEVDTVICHHYFNIPIAKKVRALIPAAQLVLETQDVQSNHYANGNALHLLTRRTSSFADTLRDEMAIAGEADLLIHYNEHETAVFREQLPQHRHLTIFPAFPRNYLRLQSEGPPNNPFDFLIVASGNDPNYHSIHWFLEEVWTPELDARFKLQIVGNVDVLFKMYKDSIYEPYRHCFVGRVESLFEYYKGARVVLLPVTEGQGISIKTVESLSFGKTMISTPLAFRGFREHVPNDLLVEETKDAAEMRQKILAVDLSGNPRPDPRAAKLYEQLFSVDSQTEIYRSIVARPPQ